MEVEGEAGWKSRGGFRMCESHEFIEKVFNGFGDTTAAATANDRDDVRLRP